MTARFVPSYDQKLSLQETSLTLFHNTSIRNEEETVVWALAGKIFDRSFIHLHVTATYTSTLAFQLQHACDPPISYFPEAQRESSRYPQAPDCPYQ
jgi:hypothetical protein